MIFNARKTQDTKASKHQPKKLNFELFFADTSIKIHIENLQIYVVFRLSLNLFWIFYWNA